jgi:quinol monooxygenase YgiN
MLTWLIWLVTSCSFASSRRVRVALSQPPGERHVSEIVVVGSFTAQPGKEEEALELFRGLVAPTHAEDGCILYALHQGVDDSRRMAFVERWASREQLDAHLASPHISEALKRVGELFGDSADIAIYDAVPGGDSAKGSLAAHAGSS